MTYSPTAFPIPRTEWDDPQTRQRNYMGPQAGMTLRDYFAAHAPTPHNAMPLDEHAAYRYRYADAMLKARE
jgi:hypothetical protein